MHWDGACNNGRVFSRATGNGVAFGIALYHSSCPTGTAYLVGTDNCMRSGAGSRRTWYVR